KILCRRWNFGLDLHAGRKVGSLEVKRSCMAGAASREMARIKPKRVLPGFRLTLGFAITYLTVMILIPLLGLFAKTFTMGWHAFYATATSARVLASLRLSFGTAAAAAGVS